MYRTKVAVLKASPETVLEDYNRLMHMAEFERYLPKYCRTALKINVSWQKFFPGCSTTPWQLEGVIRTLLASGYKRDLLYGCHNRTVVVDGLIGEVLNRQKPIIEKYGLGNVHLQPKRLSDFKKLIEKGEWIKFEPKGKMLALYRIFPKGIYIPKRFFGENILHLPTLKTHVHTTMTGAMKNAFGALLHHERHWAHGAIHEILVDLLTIQKEIFSGLFAVMDGTYAGSGAGPRSMIPYKADLILASGDMVAIDAVASKIMGFNPMDVKCIRLAHEQGLGVGDLKEIEVVGMDISEINLGFKAHDNFASRGQKMIYGGILKPLESFLMKSPIVPWSYQASRLYYDVYWYNRHGCRYVKEYMDSTWGRLFNSYRIVKG